MAPVWAEKKKAQERLNELHTIVQRKMADGTVTNRLMDQVESEAQKLLATIKSCDNAQSMSHMGDMYPAGPVTKSIHGAKWNPASPMQATQTQWKNLFAATRSGIPGYRISIGASVKGIDSGSWEIGLKDGLSEGAPGSLLQPVMLPNAFPLPLESDRLFSHFPGAAADTQAVTWLQHTGNTGAAAPVAELTLKPTLGMQITPKTVSFTTIAVLQSFSRQLADDFQSWMSFVPEAMTRAVIDQETAQIVSGDGTSPNMRGLLNTSGVLTRAKGSDSYIDAIVKATNDLRIGSAYATADLAVMSPTTWTLLKTQKDSQGRYLLALNQPNDIGSIDNIFGVKVIVNTKVPDGKAIILDSTKAVLGWTRQGLEVQLNQYGNSEFDYNRLTYRVEQRIAIGVQYPTAINIVTGLT